jgi:methionyl-tRNA formyltransferase
VAGAKTYIVAGCKPWNRRVFEETIGKLPGEWRYIGDPNELTLERLQPLAPRYIFFLHWSWKVPDEILERFECVCFHMADLPYGRGGSPLQNLIVRGHKETKLTALRMVREFDAGPIYFKEPLSLDGSAEEILVRASELSANLIQRLVEQEPTPTPQQGEPVVFKRRKPQENEIRNPASLEELYDFIRMLDAEGYPRAFIERDGFRFEFDRAVLYDGRIVADVSISPLRSSKKNGE